MSTFLLLVHFLTAGALSMEMAENSNIFSNIKYLQILAKSVTLCWMTLNLSKQKQLGY